MSNKEPKLVQVWVLPETKKKIKVAAAKKGIKIYQELENKYENS